MSIPEQPFTILALAPFGLVPDSGAKPRVIAADSANLDPAVAAVAPSVYLNVPVDLCPDGALEVRIDSMAGFHPDRIVTAVPFLNTLHQAALYLRGAIAAHAPEADVAARLRQFKGLPIVIAEKAAPRPAAPSAVDDLLAMVAAPSAPAAPAAGKAGGPEAWLTQLEDAIAKLLAHVFAHEDLRRYEAAWRGLELLAREAGPKARLNLVTTSYANLDDTLRALEPDLIRDPPSLIIVDFPLDISQRSMELLAQLAGLAESVLAPAVAEIDERFFHLSRWEDLHKLSMIPHLIDEAPYAKWRGLRKKPAANWIAVTVNRVLARRRYGKEDPPKQAFFEEPDYLFTGSVWALAALIAQRAAKTGWPTRFSEYNVTRLSGLPVAASREPAAPVEADLPDERVHQLVDIGVIPVLGPAGKDQAFVTHAVTMSGSSLGYQLVLARVIGALLKLKDAATPGQSAGEIESELTAALTRLLTSGGESPDLSVQVRDQGLDQPAIVSLSITPPEAILPGGKKIELSLPW